MKDHVHIGEQPPKQMSTQLMNTKLITSLRMKHDRLIEAYRAAIGDPQKRAVLWAELEETMSRLEAAVSR